MTTYLTPQQRSFLAEAAKHEWVSPRMFEGAGKARGGNTSRRSVTTNSAYKVLRRLGERGLLETRTPNPVMFSITDAGQKALRENRGTPA